MSAAEGAAQSLIDVWASEVRRLVPEVRALRQQYDLDLELLEKDEDPPSLDEHFLYATWRRFWAAEHHLVWAAHQLEVGAASRPRAWHRRARTGLGAHRPAQRAGAPRRG